MNIKSEKGVTGIDITVSIIIITLFLTIIITLMYMINKESNAVERRTEATNYAINEIETIKATDFLMIDSLAGEGNIGDTGYYKKITITDYADLEENQGKNVMRDVVKKVTVEISYKDENQPKTVTLSTVVTKND